MLCAKYPRTPHLPWSPGVGSDDKVIKSLRVLISNPLIITEKLDGSNLCMTNTDLFARSHSGSPSHPSFDLAKQIHAQVRNEIPSGESWFFEWCFAVHSIEYESLSSYLNMITVRDESTNTWLSWEDIQLRASALSLTTVPVISETTVTGSELELEKTTTSLIQAPSKYGKMKEGLVLRIKDSFTDEDFGKSVAKWVRAGHVQTDEHWTNKKIMKQGLKQR